MIIIIIIIISLSKGRGNTKGTRPVQGASPNDMYFAIIISCEWCSFNIHYAGLKVKNCCIVVRAQTNVVTFI